MPEEKKPLPKLTFSWSLAGITERRGATRGIGESMVLRNPDESRCFEVIGRILKKCDPEGKKSVERLKKSLAE